jgi:hypothetical protein
MLEQQVSSLTGRYRLAEDTIHRLNEQLEACPFKKLDSLFIVLPQGKSTKALLY